MTPQGKAAVSQNAFKHGLRSERYISVESDPSKFHAYCARLVALHQPQNENEEHYVERMAITYYKLCFLEGREEDPSNHYGDHNLTAIWQHQTRLERSYDRARVQLRQLQEERRKQQAEVEAKVEAETKKQTSQNEVKEEARKIVTEALSLVVRLRQAPKPDADEDDDDAPPIEVVYTDPAASPLVTEPQA